LSAKKYTPDSILSTFDEFRKAISAHEEQKVSSYPIQSLNDMLGGIHQGEVIIVKGAEGLGKTELFRLIEDHLLRTTNMPFGIIHLEENAGTTIQGIVSYYIKDKVSLDDGIHDDKFVFDMFTEAVGNDESRLMLYNAFDTEEERVFLDNIRFMVTVGGAKGIFFDHITWMATGSSQDEDERRKLDRISQKLANMARELGFFLFMISHVNDDGKTRGSRNITKVANTVIHLERNKEHPSPDERNKMHLTVEKARRRGCQTGPAGYLMFDPSTTNLVDVASRTIT
jgi:predicted ATP-dependent serine protease